MDEIKNERNAGRKKKYSVETKSKTFRYPKVCEEKIVAAIKKITKPYLNDNKHRKN